MAFQKQVPFKKRLRTIMPPKPIPKVNNGYVYKAKKNETSTQFIDDWKNCRDRHPGQLEVLQAVFEYKFKYIFYRAGRKGAKTTTAIDVAWRIANEESNRVVYLCYPTIAQGIEVVWEERRLQTCDQKDDRMFHTYVDKVDDSRHIVKFLNGSFIKLIGTWTEARGRGTQPDFLIFDEVQDCSGEYIEAMDANLAAKPHSQCVMMGTPPKKRNHYEEWIARIDSNPQGKIFHYTSYDNIKLPHLKDWLDNKKIELMKAGKEDVWLREYMAEICYASADRILPDAKFLSQTEIQSKASLFHFSERIPVLAICSHHNYFCAILCVLIHSKMVMVMDCVYINQTWDKSIAELHPDIKQKVKELQDFCGKKIRNIVWDESESFVDIVKGFTTCRSDIKWQDRGFPILKELMVKEKILFSQNLSDFGIECQNLLLDDGKKEIQRSYPRVCTIAMMVNEFFAQEKIIIHQENKFDEYQALRDMGIPYTPRRKSKSFIFGLS